MVINQAASWLDQVELAEGEVEKAISSLSTYFGTNISNTVIPPTKEEMVEQLSTEPGEQFIAVLEKICHALNWACGFRAEDFSRKRKKGSRENIDYTIHINGGLQGLVEMERAVGVSRNNTFGSRTTIGIGQFLVASNVLKVPKSWSVEPVPDETLSTQGMVSCFWTIVLCYWTIISEASSILPKRTLVITHPMNLFFLKPDLEHDVTEPTKKKLKIKPPAKRSCPLFNSNPQTLKASHKTETRNPTNQNRTTSSDTHPKRSLSNPLNPTKSTQNRNSPITNTNNNANDNKYNKNSTTPVIPDNHNNNSANRTISRPAVPTSPKQQIIVCNRSANVDNHKRHNSTSNSNNNNNNNKRNNNNNSNNINLKEEERICIEINSDEEETKKNNMEKNKKDEKMDEDKMENKEETIEKNNIRGDSNRLRFKLAKQPHFVTKDGKKLYYSEKTLILVLKMLKCMVMKASAYPQQIHYWNRGGNKLAIEKVFKSRKSSTVFRAVGKDNRRVVVKREYRMERAGEDYIFREAEILRLLEGTRGVPRLEQCHIGDHSSWIITSPCGKNLFSVRERMYELCRDKKSLEELLKQLTVALDGIHGRGVVHGDIKPQNLIVFERVDFLFIDFGGSFLRSECPYQGDVFVTRDFCSRSVGQGKTPDFTDDWESLLYSLYFFVNSGSLGWEDVGEEEKTIKKQELLDRIGAEKCTLSELLPRFI
eukprot:TRINITY_DN426_c0_g2_i1.p1 TRINITY_DN426_c0_g2~~TRINITY_DN426_c0_g2_i1.p1  ORF type:complete len:761 (-),score=123.42 TRINITY_DN426_c0_g2_i1:38-2164(-)